MMTLITGQTDNHISMLNTNVGLHHQVIAPWQAMCQHALQDGFTLNIASGFRSFERQLSIWNRKFTGELPIKDLNNAVIDIASLTEDEIIHAILTFSALPGTSRHHWGTDLDFYSHELLAANQTLQLEPWEYQANGPFAELTQWLHQHAIDYGFYFPYDKYRGGVAQEPWHLSYFPLADQFEQQLTVNELAHCLQASDIMAKQSIIKQLDTILTQYVFNIGHVNNE